MPGMSHVHESPAISIAPALLPAVHALASSEGRELQSLVDEALSDLLEKHRQNQPRAHVMAAYQTSHGPFASLYQQLAQ